MPEDIEIETNDLRETVDDLQEKLDEERKDRQGGVWIRYIALTTAFLAVFAAVGALQSGSLVNEAMIQQLRSSDAWNEYQASREKSYVFSTQATDLLDRGIIPAVAGEKNAGVDEKRTTPDETEGDRSLRAMTPSARLADLLHRIDREQTKQKPLEKRAEALERSAERSLERHHHFAWSVALIQVAIALSAIAALTRMRWVWFLSILIGSGGIVLFFMGTFSKT